jgi:cytochrome P450
VIPLRWPVRSPDGKHVLHEVPVTKGQVIHVPSRTANRLARVWGPDADVFVPERWLDPACTRPSPEDLTNGWAGIFTFSEGPRTCVGYRLGASVPSVPSPTPHSAPTPSSRSRSF